MREPDPRHGFPRQGPGQDTGIQHRGNPRAQGPAGVGVQVKDGVCIRPLHIGFVSARPGRAPADLERRQHGAGAVHQLDIQGLLRNQAKARPILW